MVRLAGLGDAQAGPAVGRPAAAGRAGPRDRERARGAAARRAARRARPEAAPGDAARAQADPARGRHHLRLRHPRPGGGADDERPPGRVQPGPDRAARHARSRCTSGRPASSSPASSASPTCSSATAGGSRSARRRSGCSADGEQPPAGRPRRAGRIEEVTYLGMVTRYVVELTAGGTAHRGRQNLETAAAEALGARAAGGHAWPGATTRRTRSAPGRRPASPDEQKENA